MSISKKVLILIFTILIIDQLTKILVKTSMTLGETNPVFGHWFIIKFIENSGMAFGMDIPGKFGKLILSLFRIIAVGAIGYYLYVLIKRKVHPGLILSIAAIFAGAMGNIIDSVFYGIIFGESTYTTVAHLFPEGGGYTGLLHGKVVDMLYFPLAHIHLPNWLPIWGGRSFIFFGPIFNIADSAISVGVFFILIFQKRFFKGLDK